MIAMFAQIQRNGRDSGTTDPTSNYYPTIWGAGQYVAETNNKQNRKECNVWSDKYRALRSPHEAKLE